MKNFRNDTLGNLRLIDQYKKIERYIAEDLPYHTELDTAFGKLRSWWSPYPVYTGYTTLKTKGLDIISNESLRNKIVDMFENKLTLVTSDYDRDEWGLMQQVVAPYCSRNIRMHKEGQHTLGRPNDFERLKRDDEFGNILGMILSARHTGLIYYKRAMILIEELIESIDEELKNRPQ